MKLEFHGHDERYVVEQSLMNLFPGELPVYEPIAPGDGAWAKITCDEAGDYLVVTTDLFFHGQSGVYTYGAPLSGTDFDREGQRRHAVGACFYLARREMGLPDLPWGMLTGVRPDKPVTWALEQGKTPREAQAFLEGEYFVTPERASISSRRSGRPWRWRPAPWRLRPRRGWGSGTSPCTWASPSVPPAAPTAPS